MAACVISTIFPQYENRIFPDVQAMVESFQIKRPPKRELIDH